MEKPPIPSDFRDSGSNFEHLREQRLKLIAEIETNGRKILEEVGAKYYVVLCKGGDSDQSGYNYVGHDDEVLKEPGREDEVNKQHFQTLVYDQAIPEWTHKWTYHSGDEYGYIDLNKVHLPVAEIGIVSPTLTEEESVYLNPEGTEILISTYRLGYTGELNLNYTNKTRARIVDGKINNDDLAEDNVGLFATQEEAQAWAKTKMEEAARDLRIYYSREKYEEREKERKAEEQQREERYREEGYKEDLNFDEDKSEGKKPVRFFDSHGGLWETCSADDPKAQAFGPQGTAKEISAEQAGLQLNQGESLWSAAKRAGRVVEKEEDTDWELLSE